MSAIDELLEQYKDTFYGAQFARVGRRCHRRTCRSPHRNVAMKAALADYIAHFDDDSLWDETVKMWLDAEWIPCVRELLSRLSA